VANDLQTIERDAAAAHEQHLQRLEQMARWLDRRYLDPILGMLLPGAGDVLGAVLGLVSIGFAVRMRAHPLVIARMLVNLTIDALLGAIPLFGDISDFLYRAHVRNLELLKRRTTGEARATDWLVVAAAGLAFLLALCLPVLLLVGVVQGFKHLQSNAD
jgi:hypothetical protein